MGMIDEVKNQQAQLIDVRRDDEWQNTHAEGAIHLEVERILQGDIDILDKDQPLYVYCASGGRAGVAADYLNNKGYKAKNIGGLSAWKQAGGAIV